MADTLGIKVDVVLGDTKDIQKAIDGLKTPPITLKISAPSEKRLTKIADVVTRINDIAKETGGAKIQIFDNVDFVKSSKAIQNLEKDLKNLKNTSANIEMKKSFRSEEVAVQELILRQRELGASSTETAAAVDNVVAAIVRLRDAKGPIEQAEAQAKFNLQLKAAKKELDEVDKAAKKGAGGVQSMDGAVDQLTKRFFGLVSVQRVFQMLVSTFRDVADTIIAMDKQIVNLQMVTMGTREETTALLATYSEMGRALGSTTGEVAESANEWLRQGKSVEETNELIRASMVLSKISGMDSAQSTKLLTAAMKGYGVEVENVYSILDAVSSIDLESATSAEGLMLGMSRVANFANEVGISMERLLGMIATVGETTQRDMGSIGDSFKTIFSRMSNIKLNKLELIDEGQVEDLSDVERSLSRVGIELRDEAYTFRNFGDVLDEINGKWSSFDDVTKRSIASALGGARRIEDVLALMNNYSKAMGLANTALGASGTAQQKFDDAYLNSVEAAANRMQAAMEQLHMTTMNGDFMKGWYQLQTVFIDLATNVGGLIPIVLALGAALMVIAAPKISSGISAIGMTIVSVVKGTASAMTSLTASIGLIGVAIAAITMIGSLISNAHENASERAERLATETQEAEAKSKALNSELITTAARIDELKAKGPLSIVEGQELRKLEEANKLLQVRLELAERNATLARVEELRNKSDYYATERKNGEWEGVSPASDLQVVMADYRATKERQLLNPGDERFDKELRSLEAELNELAIEAESLRADLLSLDDVTINEFFDGSVLGNLADTESFLLRIYELLDNRKGIVEIQFPKLEDTFKAIQAANNPRGKSAAFLPLADYSEFNDVIKDISESMANGTFDEDKFMADAMIVPRIKNLNAALKEQGMTIKEAVEQWDKMQIVADEVVAGNVKQAASAKSTASALGTAKDAYAKARKEIAENGRVSIATYDEMQASENEFIRNSLTADGKLKELSDNELARMEKEVEASKKTSAQRLADAQKDLATHKFQDSLVAASSDEALKAAHEARTAELEKQIQDEIFYREILDANWETFYADQLNAAKKTTVMTDALIEQAKTGKLSAETLAKLKLVDEDYADALQVVNGEVKVNTRLQKEKSDAIKKAAYDQALLNGETEEYARISSGYTETIKDQTSAISQHKDAWSTVAKVLEAQKSGGGKITSEQAIGFIEADERVASMLVKQADGYKLSKTAQQQYYRAMESNKGAIDGLIEELQGSTGYVERFGDILSQISKDGSLDDLAGNAIGLMKGLNKQFIDGKIEFEEYFAGLNAAIRNVKWKDGFANPDTKQSTQDLYMATAEATANSFNYLNNQFASGTITSLEYINTLKTMNEETLATRMETEGLTMGLDGLIGSYDESDFVVDEVANALKDSIDMVNGYSDAIEFLTDNYKLLGKVTDENGKIQSDFAKKLKPKEVEKLKNELIDYSNAMISAGKNDEIAQIWNDAGGEIKYVQDELGNTTGEIDDIVFAAGQAGEGMLTFAGTVQDSASKGMAAVKNAAGDALIAMGNALTDFKYSINIDTTPMGGSILGFIFGGKGPSARIDIEASGGAALGGAVAAYGESMKAEAALASIFPAGNKAPKSGGSKGGGGGSSKEKTPAEIAKEEFEDHYAALKHQRNMDYIDDKEFYDRLAELNEKYYAGSEDNIKEYRSHLEELWDLRRKMNEKQIEDSEHQLNLLEKSSGTEKDQIAIYQNMQNMILQVLNEYRDYGLAENNEYIQELKEQWWDYAEAIKEIEKGILEAQKALVDQLKSDSEGAVAGVVDVIDREIAALNDKIGAINDEIKALEGEKKALQEANKEKDKAIQLAELEAALEKARERTIRIYRKDVGFVYEQDTDAVRKAEDALGKFREQEAIDALDKEIEAKKEAQEVIKEEIDGWEKYKEQWTTIADAVEEEQNRLKAVQLLGADFEEKILQQRTDVLEKFAEDYKNVLREIIDLTEQMNAMDRESIAAGQDASVMGSVGVPTSTTKASDISATLRRGDSGENVKRLQQTLLGLGYAVGIAGASGTFDEGLEYALRAFQSENGLQQTGTLDTATKERLKLRGFRVGRVGGVSTLAHVDEQGMREMIVRQDGSRIKYLEHGDSVIPFQQTNTLLALATNPVQFLASALAATPLMQKGANPTQYDIGDIIIQRIVGNAEDVAREIRMNLPNAITQFVAKT